MKRILLFAITIFVLKASVGYCQSLVWAEQIGYSAGCSQRSYTQCLTSDKNGHIYAAGSLGCSSDMDPGSGVSTSDTVGHSNAFIQKVTSSGILVWAKVLNSTYDIGIAAMTIDDTGNLLITGTYGGTADFNPEPTAQYLLTAVGGHQQFTAKYDSMGSLKWVHTTIGTNYCYGAWGRCIALDSDNNVYVGGRYCGDLYCNGTTFSDTFLSTMSTYDAFIEKLSPDGDHIWARSIGGEHTDSMCSISVDKYGNVFCVGTFQGAVPVDLDPGAGTSSFLPAGVNDVFILKLTPSSSLTWAKTLSSFNTGSTTSLIAHPRLTIDTVGNLLICGGFNGIVDFNPSPAPNDTAFLHGPDGLAGWAAGFVLKLDNNGSIIWVDKFDGIASCYDIKTDSALNIYVTGTYGSATDFDPGPATYNVPPVGGTEQTYMHKLSTDNHFMWAAGIGVSWGRLTPTCIAVTDTNKICIGGYFIGTADFDPGTSVYTIVNDLDIHGFVARYNYTFPAVIDPGGVGVINSGLYTIYPNPTTGDIFVNSKTNINEIVVTNMIGQVVYRSFPGKMMEELTIHGQGMYFISLFSGDDVATQKVFVTGQ